MDYDDNDFQSQNFQLVGEDSNKFPAGLRSFTLPKFDLDDHFEVHLRFDSLVGIHSQESNWIENFSPGGSALEFSPSAAESCSISRHNVWSEATSSESVEMLLKSVGDDEMLNEKAVVKFDASDGVAGIEGHMDLCSKKDESQSLKVNMEESNPALPDKSSKGILASNKALERDQPLCVEVLSQSSKEEKSMVSDACSLDDKFDSSRQGICKSCTIDEQPMPSDNLSEKGLELTIFFEPVPKESSLNDDFIVKTADDCQNSVAMSPRGLPRCDNSGIQDGDLAASNCNHEVSAGKFSSPSCSDEVIDQCSEEIAKDSRSEALVLDDARKEIAKSQAGDLKLNDLPSEDHMGQMAIYNMKDDSLLQENLDSSMLLTEGCNDSVFAENRDGLLEAIAYPVKVSSKDRKSGDKIAMQMEEISSLVTGDTVIRNFSAEKSNRGTNKLEQFENVVCDIQEVCQNDSPHSNSMLLIKNSKNVDDQGQRRDINASSQLAKEKHDFADQIIGKGNGDVRDTSRTALKPHVSFRTAHDAQAAENRKDGGNLGLGSERSPSQKPQSANIEKLTACEAIEKHEGTENAPENVILEKSCSVASLSSADTRISSSRGGRSLEMCDAGIVVGQNTAPVAVVDVLSTKKMIRDDLEQEQVNLSLPESDFIPLDDKEVPSSSICNVNVDAGPSVPKTQTDLQALLEVQSSSSGEKSGYTSSKDTLEAPADNTVTDEHAVGLEGNLVLNASVVEAKADLDSTECFSQEKSPTLMSVETMSQGGTQASPNAPSGEISSLDTGENKQQRDGNKEEAIFDRQNQNLIAQAEINSAICNKRNSPRSFKSPRAASDAPGARVGFSSSSEANCGSPTIISCSECNQNEIVSHKENRDSPYKTEPVEVTHTGADTDVIKSVPDDPKETTASEDDRSFTFEVGSLRDFSAKDIGNNWKPFSSIQSFELPQMSKQSSQESHLESGETKLPGVIVRTADEDKNRSTSGCSNERTATSRETPAKESRSTQMDESSSCTLPTSVGMISRDVQLEEMQQYPYSRSSSMKASCSPAIQTSSLPDLNTSISAAALCHQPFTDPQQVQLRAQIFVYGSLIQGIAPDEACMVSAFGETVGGGRSSWECIWRAALERSQKSPLAESPSQSRSVVRFPEQVTRSSSLQSKDLSPSASRSGTRAVPAPLLSSATSLQSPLWGISSHDGLHSNMPRGMHLDFNQALTPLHSYQSPQVRQYSVSAAPWLSQTPHPGSLVVASQSSGLDAPTQYSAVPVSATVQSTSVRDLSVSRTSNLQLVPPSALLSSPGGSSISPIPVMQAESQNKTSTPGKNKTPANAQKSRKRKKAPLPDELGPVFPVSQCQTEPTVADIAKHVPVPTSLPLSTNSLMKVNPGSLVPATTNSVSPAHYQIIGSSDKEQRFIFSEEISGRIEQAKLLAEDAAAFAASALKHSQGVWSHLAVQKNSGLVSELEQKLASAAVAASAAASVAKAAAAAAKVASDAALQAKMMADEALNSDKRGNPPGSAENDIRDVGTNFAILSPVSILKGKDQIQGSSLVISAAREVARRRVEAASAATKRAENLDAIVKAAELAAEAVSQAGTIIAMGDPVPLTLSQLAEAGPEGYWKVHQADVEKNARTSSWHVRGLHGVDDQVRSVRQVNDGCLNHDTKQATTEDMHSEQNHAGNGLGNTSSISSRHERDYLANNLRENIIQKETLVEVVSDEDGLRGVWFSAKVLDVKDGKAYVCYNDLLHDEGSGHLKEWIPIEGEGDKAPRVRIAHPMTALRSDGTRKRRRGDVGSYVWEVGDHVDAWIRDGWWEGIVAEKSEEDETKLTIHFPAGGDSSTVRAWNLRPSLIWKDGQWVEWSRRRENTQFYQGDTPQEKRQKVGRSDATIESEVGGRGTDNMSKSLHFEASRKLDESRTLMLSAKDRIFSVGKSVREATNSDALKVRGTGLQREGSRVVFGVPKPGKKRKFMEVSKHYVAEKSDKTSEANDTVKFAKYLMPQASRLVRNPPKVDAKAKRVGDAKARWSKSVKSRNVQTRSTAEKENSSVTNRSDSNGGESGQEPLLNNRACFVSEENKLDKNILEVGSSTKAIVMMDIPVLESSFQPVHSLPLSKKKFSAEADLGTRGKVTSAVEKTNRNEEKGAENLGRTATDAIEPRRSNRRIQPTSRLLEGLQSSLIISKIPSVLHDRGSKALRSSSRGNTHG